MLYFIYAQISFKEKISARTGLFNRFFLLMPFLQVEIAVKKATSKSHTPVLMAEAVRKYKLPVVQ